MAAGRRNTDESFEDYRKRLRTEEKQIRADKKGRMVFVSYTWDAVGNPLTQTYVKPKRGIQ